MRSFTIRLHLIPFVGCVVCATFIGCVAFDPAVQSTVEDLNERPSVAILPFGFDLEITKLSDMKTANEMLSPEEESKQVAEALREIQREARWLLLSRLAAGRGFQFVPPEQTDALAEELQLKPGVLPNPEQLTEFRRRLGTDLVVVGSILDYGKVRWQWMLAGMTTDMTAESLRWWLSQRSRSDEFSLARILFRRERGHDLFEAWIAAQRIPIGALFKIAVSDATQELGRGLELI